MIKKYICTLFFISQIMFQAVQAQFVVADRFEFSMERFGRQDYDLIALEGKGILVIENTEHNTFSQEVKIKIHRFNNSLDLLQTSSHVLPSSLFQSNRLLYYDRVGHLYIYGNESYGRKFDIFRLNVLSGKGIILVGELPFNMAVKRLSAIDETAYFIGEAKNKPVVLKYNFVEQIPKVLPSFFGDDEVLGSISPAPNEKKVYFSLANTDRTDCRLSLQAYSTLLGLNKRTFIETQGRYTPKDALILPSNDDNNNGVIFGTYSMDCQNQMMQGLFTGKFKDGQPAKVNFYPFVDFTNIFANRSEKREEKMRRKVEVKQRRGKTYRLNERFSLRPRLLSAPRQEWLAITEKYYTQYQSINAINPYSMRNQRNVPINQMGAIQPNNRSRQSFRFTYALICAFDANGRRKWDNIMKIEDVENNYLIPVVQVGSQGDSLVTAYIIPEDDEIYSKKIHRYRTLREETKQDLKDIFAKQDVANSFDSQLMHLEQNRFLIFGEQRLKHPNPEQLGRRVFHLTVVEYVDMEEEKDKKKKTAKKKRDKKDKAEPEKN